MVRIAPVRLEFNPKTLWFDAGSLELAAGDAVVVTTARGSEYGVLADDVFDMEYERVRTLKSPLKPVQRLADDDDRAAAGEAAELSQAALPVFRRMAAELAPDMNPIAVEYLFDGSKAVFYFDSEERVDFRDLVRKLASELHVRVDMKQIGVRDGARMVGGLGHCGQELCCRRLGGEFNPVSIRMAKEQDLSLNPQKISGVCGRLMCCLRYEFEAYKDFHGRAPKKNARISTPDGEGKVVDLDVPREVISIKVGDEKPVKVPLADMEPAEKGQRPNAVGEDAWARANEPAALSVGSGLNLFSTQLTADDKLAEPGSLRHVHDGEEPKKSRSRSRRRSGSDTRQNRASRRSEQPEKAAEATDRKQRRRRSITVKSDGTAKTETQRDAQSGEGSQVEAKAKASNQRRRSRRSSASDSRRQAQGDGARAQSQSKTSKVGRNSSALRAGRDEAAQEGASSKARNNSGRRRRRSHKAASDGSAPAKGN